jgi:NAD(P)-dependent dehydrogenase (short-subunit alcohol dehydrogenase family)
VTGGNSGIGLATVLSFLQAGARVACLDLAESAVQSADNLHYEKCDVTSEDSVKVAVANIADKLGKIDILINNAGITDNLEAVADVSSSTWHQVMAVNTTGPFNMMQACIPHMLKNEPKAAPDAPPSFSWMGEQKPPLTPSKGVIINICSEASVHGACAGAAYTASKHALLGLSRNTAWMYREQGLRVNAILPGGVITNMSKNSAGKISPQGYQTLMPFLGCQNPTLMMPDAIANAVLFLAGSGAERISGAELTVDGGWNSA